MSIVRDEAKKQLERLDEMEDWLEGFDVDGECPEDVDDPLPSIEDAFLKIRDSLRKLL